MPGNFLDCFLDGYIEIALGFDQCNDCLLIKKSKEKG